MKNEKRHRFLWAVIYGIILVAFTVYVMLDTFVIKKEYVKLDSNSSNVESDSSTDNNSGTQAETTESSYKDDNINITLKKYHKYDTDIYVADIKLSDIKYLRTALAGNTYGKNVTDTTSDMASENNAILAINGDFYGARNNGYVVRNGKVLRNTSSSDSQQDLAIYSDGSFKIIEEGSIKESELEISNIVQIL